MEKVIKSYVEKVSSMGLYNNIIIEEVEERNPSKVENDGDSFVFWFFDKELTVDNGRVVEWEFKNSSPYIFFGERISLDELKKIVATNQEYAFLESKLLEMEKMDNKFICHTQDGGYHIMNDEDMTYDEVVSKTKW